MGKVPRIEQLQETAAENSYSRKMEQKIFL